LGKVKNEIFEDNFSKRSSSSYELSILLGVDSFAYIVSDSQQHILALKDFDFDGDASFENQLKAILNLEHYLKLPQRNIRVGIANQKAILLPGRLYQEQEKKTYLGELTQVKDDLEVRADNLAAMDIKNVYAIDRVVYNALYREFPGCRLFHLNTVLLLGFHKHASIQHNKCIYIHTRERFLFIALFEEGKLLFANSFSYNSAKDFLYFVLLVFKQFDLDSAEIPVFLSGQLVEESEVYRLLFRYLKQISFLDPPAFFQFGPKMKSLDSYFYYDLFSLLLGN